MVFAKYNPARSGDKKHICWMTMSNEDFYWDVFRGIEFQLDVMQTALEQFGNQLVEQAANPTNSCIGKQYVRSGGGEDIEG